MVLAWLFAFPLGLGSTGVWYALAIGVALDGLIMGMRWRGKAWLDVAMHRTELYRRHLRYLDDGLQQQYLADIRTPLMAQPGVREQVEDEQVVYTLPGQPVHVRFAAGSYQVT